MSEQKMREALEQIKELTEIPFGHTAGDHELIYQMATEALASEPGGGVVYQCPRCCTSMEVDKTAKPAAPAPSQQEKAARYLPPRKRQSRGETPATARYGYVRGWNDCLDDIAAHEAKRVGGAACV